MYPISLEIKWQISCIPRSPIQASLLEIACRGSNVPFNAFIQLAISYSATLCACSIMPIFTIYRIATLNASSEHKIPERKYSDANANGICTKTNWSPLPTLGSFGTFVSKYVKIRTRRAASCMQKEILANSKAHNQLPHSVVTDLELHVYCSFQKRPKVYLSYHVSAIFRTVDLF